jgi:hypothetical protein
VYFFQIDDIRLPFKKGTMDDISREDEPSISNHVVPVFQFSKTSIYDTFSKMKLKTGFPQKKSKSFN